MYKILENLATDGLGQPSELSAYVKCEIGFIDDYRIIDVRVLPEFDTPSSFEYKLNIMRVASYLELGEKVVVCCSHGMNRSNAIALGVLVVVRPHIGDIIAYQHGLHFCQEVYPYRNQNKVSSNT
jgi:hypothetical protein